MQSEIKVYIVRLLERDCSNAADKLSRAQAAFRRKICRFHTANRKRPAASCWQVTWLMRHWRSQRCSPSLRKLEAGLERGKEISCRSTRTR